MSDKINIASIEDLELHYKDEHGFDLPTENMMIHHQNVHFVEDGTDYLMRFCSFCGKEFVINDKKIRLYKTLEIMKNTVFLNAEYPCNDLCNMINELSTNLKTTQYITNIDLKRLLRKTLNVIITRNDV